MGRKSSKCIPQLALGVVQLIFLQLPDNFSNFYSCFIFCKYLNISFYMLYKFHGPLQTRKMIIN